MRIVLVWWVFGVMCAVAGREARAGDDLAAFVSKRCIEGESDTAKRARNTGDAQDVAARASAYNALCGDNMKSYWAKLEGKHYPRQYFRVTLGVDVCRNLERLTARNDANGQVRLAEVCGTPAPPETSAPSFSATGINLVLGLGDLLVAEAKQEVLEYLLSRLGKRFCRYAKTIEAPAPGNDPAQPAQKQTIAMLEWFKHSCAVMLPNGVDGAVDVEAFSFGALKAAFKTDLRGLPGHIAAPARVLVAKRWPGAPSYAIAAGVAMYLLYGVVQGKTPIEILNDVGDKADVQLAKVKCDLTAKPTKECTLLLGFELGRTAANTLSKERNAAPSKIIGDTLDKFCAAHGATDLTANGSCVVGKDDYEQWHARILAIYREVKRLIELERMMATMAASSTPDEISKRVLPSLGHSVRQLLEALGGATADALPEDKAEIAKDLVILGIAFDAFDAIVADDPAALGAALHKVLTQIGKESDAELARAVTVVVAIATAKDRTEVKAILADVVAPVGSYKRKYGATSPLISINGFVGFFAGGEIRLHSRNDDGTRHDPFIELAPLKLRTPIGVDFSLVSGGRCIVFWESGTCNHVGILATLIDPLALSVSTKGDTLSAEWKTLFEPGLYVRFGVFRSPFTIALGGNYQWARRSDRLCGQDRCFDGAFQIGAFLSADVPLLVLR